MRTRSGMEAGMRETGGVARSRSRPMSGTKRDKFASLPTRPHGPARCWPACFTASGPFRGRRDQSPTSGP